MIVIAIRLELSNRAKWHLITGTYMHTDLLHLIMSFTFLETALGTLSYFIFGTICSLVHVMYATLVRIFARQRQMVNRAKRIINQRSALPLIPDRLTFNFPSHGWNHRDSR
jgi:hypothetical protein